MMLPPHGHKKMKETFPQASTRAQGRSPYSPCPGPGLDEAEEDEVAVPATAITNKKKKREDVESEDLSEDEGAEARGQKTKKKNATDMNDNMSEDEGEGDGEVLQGITKFTDGCRAFKMAFRNIIEKSVPDDSLEDDKIIELVQRHGPTKWSLIAKSLSARIGKQCRERWVS
ncbi:hypothetical protein RIF29_15809 [Crotalaria pallida]|uniref:Uncharacterized protein n=1 Tax=Crotalaria pallida TaxID=3830 RepID=A0AAN9FE95_CROPI